MLETISYSLEDPRFYEHLHEKIAKKEIAGARDPLEKLLLEEWIDTCKKMDETVLQDSWCWRNVHIARELAYLLIDEKGEIKKATLTKTIDFLTAHLYSLGPQRHHDAVRREELLHLLELLYHEPKLSSEFRKIGKPGGHQIADRLIRETVFLKATEAITDFHAKWAVLSALFTKLRQNVGSCFATAPAILIQQQQPEQFVSDMVQILGTGRLSRIVDGIEQSVPLSTSWGVGDLHRSFLLSSLGDDPCYTLSRSPGMLAALKAAGILDEGLIAQREACEKLLRTSPYLNSEEAPFVVVTPDQILRSVLLHFYELTSEDVENYKNRPHEGVIGGLMIQMPQTREGKSLACLRYLKSYQEAVSSFKSMTDNALLKAWEFTLASLSETKADFARWNLYASLGLQPEEPYGIGECLYTEIQQKINVLNEEIEAYQSKYDHVYAQLHSLEGRANRAGTESELGWLQAEYQRRKFELHRISSERDEMYEKGRALSQLLPFLFSFYDQKFKEYFQEIYDAEMHDLSENPYDDSPAGFRLLYKHGRLNTALWTLISTPGEFLQVLSSFVASTGSELVRLPQVSGIEVEVAELMTAVLVHIKRPEFLESAFLRLASAYREPVVKDPLENLGRVKRKPWSYISGGTMATLVHCYYESSKKIEEKARWIESELELLVFFIDTIRDLPPNVQATFRNNTERSLLAFSPTHAFLCKPGWEPFQRGWETESYTYTWVRDRWVLPQQHFLSSIVLDTRMMQFLIEKISQVIPGGYRFHFKNLFQSLSYTMEPFEFREYLLKSLSYERWVQGSGRLEWLADEIDSCLYKSLPLFPDHLLEKRLEAIFELLFKTDLKLKKRALAAVKRVQDRIGHYKIFSSEDLRRMALSLVLLSEETTKSSHFYYQLVTETMRELGYALPGPILFADTNWVKNVFGFVVNPGSAQLELWRFDECGSEGTPMRMWKQYVNGTSRQEWGLYTNPYQYEAQPKSLLRGLK